MVTRAQRIGQVGVERGLYGTDAPTANNLPRSGWAAFRALPLTDAEFQPSPVTFHRTCASVSSSLVQFDGAADGLLTPPLRTPLSAAC
jgi:hypothetical protein